MRSGPPPKEGGSPSPSPLLEVAGVELSYGPYRALFGVSFSVPPDSTVALVGANGAGKTSLARAISGLVRPSRGKVLFAGREVTSWPAWKIARAGLCHVPEGRSVLGSLTVQDNLLLSFQHLPVRGGVTASLDRAYDSFPRLAERRHQLAGTLSGGEQRMLALGRALCLEPRLLVVDELSLGLSPAFVDELFAALEAIGKTGTTLLVIEQHVERVLRLADWAVVLEEGVVADQGPAASVIQMVSQLLARDERTAAR